MSRIICFALVAVLLHGSHVLAGEADRRVLEYAPAAVDNPLKGLVPYAGKRLDAFPHSLEFNYLPLSALMKDYDRFDWTPLEELLEGVAARGRQTIFRVYLEYPGRAGAIPEFLIADGLTVHKYLNTNTQPFPPREVQTPDYADANLRRAINQFIAALGEKYDGDPRIGFITAGLLGTWGEWHTHPRNELFASKEVQIEVLDAYEAAFQTTPVLLRYPAGDDDPRRAANAHRRFGYHDDSFAWATLETGNRNDSWYFMSLMRAAGALDKWQTQPIGGEIRPEAWGNVFDANPGEPRIQNFRRCVEATRVSWLMDSGMFRRSGERNEQRIRRAEEEVRRMGYEFHVAAVTIGRGTGGALAVQVELENRGVAPFYYSWPVEFGLLGDGGHVLGTAGGTGKITGLLPDDPPRVWNEKLDFGGVAAGRYRVAVRVPNPLPGGSPIRFANRTQDADAPGWLTLGEVVWE